MIAHIIPAKRGTLRLAMLDYLVPAELEATITIGQLVTIPLRSKTEFGVVFKLTSQPATEKQLKMLGGLVHTSPILSEAQLGWLYEMSILYHTSLGFLLTSNLLPLQKRKLQTLPTPASSTPTVSKLEKPTFVAYSNEAEKKDYLLKTISPDHQTLIIVGEVHEIDRLQNLLPPELREQITTFTSELSIKETFARWIQVWTDEKKIIIGTRSALFLPWFDLAHIFIDNEGNESHKSWDMMPRFHAREAALLLAKYHGAKIHLLAHTPSVETYYFAKHGVYDAPLGVLPANEDRKYHVRNVREERRGGNETHLSTDVLEALEHKSGSVFLLCHRRGTMSHVSCRDCGHVLECPRCKRSLTYHHHSHALVCHHCGHQQGMISTCSECGGANIALFGAGTDAIAGQLRKIRPHDKRPIITIDQDKEKPTLPEGDCIIVGTYYAWSSIPWEKITTMVFVDADTPLFIPEYRLAERLWNNLHDANYFLPQNAELFIQTTHPEHPVFTSLYQPEQFYLSELSDRKMFHYPPYQYLLKIMVGGMSEAKSQSDATQVYDLLARLTDVAKNCTITKPFALTPPFQKGQFWHTILIKIPYSSYKKYWRAIATAVPESCKVDPNPLSIFSL